MARKRRAGNSEAAKQFGDFLKRHKAPIAGFTVFILIITGAVMWIGNFLTSAPCFEVNKIEVVRAGREGGLYVQKEYFQPGFPVNIFTVDPVMLSNKIKEGHPEYQVVVITKFLPDRIIATIKDREAVAKIKVARVLPIDFEGVVVSDPGELDSLPLITGLESQLVNPKEGSRVKSKRLNAALDILRAVYSRKDFRRSVIETIDMSYPDKAFFRMDGITVIIGNTDLEKRLDALAAALSKVDKAKTDTIDLRFTDSAVTFKPEKK